MANLQEMPENAKTQKHRKRSTKSVHIHLFSIGDLLAGMWKDWQWICGMWWSHTQHHTWRFACV